MNKSSKLLGPQRAVTRFGPGRYEVGAGDSWTQASCEEQQPQPHNPSIVTPRARRGRDQAARLNRRGRKGTTALVRPLTVRVATVDIAAPADSDGIARRLWCRALVRLYLRESEVTVNGDRMGLL